jgi:hypothetical protein
MARKAKLPEEEAEPGEAAGLPPEVGRLLVAVKKLAVPPSAVVSYSHPYLAKTSPRAGQGQVV